MSNTAQPPGNDVIKVAFDDWVELLLHTGNAEMLKDPYSIWLEAFHTATLFERHGVLHAIQTQMQLTQPEEFDDRAAISIDDAKQIQTRMLQSILSLIASKGLSRS